MNNVYASMAGKSQPQVHILTVAAPFGARFLTPNGAATAAARAEQSRKRQCVGCMLEFQKFRACGAKIPETPTCTHALRMPQPLLPTKK